MDIVTDLRQHTHNGQQYSATYLRTVRGEWGRIVDVYSCDECGATYGVLIRDES